MWVSDLFHSCGLEKFAHQLVWISVLPCVKTGHERLSSDPKSAGVDSTDLCVVLVL